MMTDDDARPMRKTGRDGWARSATARAKEWCADALHRGELLCWEWTEHNLSRGKLRWKSDFFGFADLVMVRKSGATSFLNATTVRPCRVELIAVQVTGGPASTGDGQKRLRKIRAQPKAAAWLATGAKIEIWEYRWRRRKGAVVAVERVVIPVEEVDAPE